MGDVKLQKGTEVLGSGVQASAEAMSRLSESAQNVDRVIKALYEGFRAQLPGAAEGVRVIDVMNKRAATDAERTLAKDYLMAQLDRVDADQGMPVEDRVIASNYLRKLLQSFESSVRAV